MHSFLFVYLSLLKLNFFSLCFSFIVIFFSPSFLFHGDAFDFQRFMSREKVKVNHAITMRFRERERERGLLLPDSPTALSHISLSCFLFLSFSFFPRLLLSFPPFSFSCFQFLLLFLALFSPNKNFSMVFPLDSTL